MKSAEYKYKYKYLAHVAFGAAAVVVVALGWVLFDASGHSKNSSLRVAHTLEVIRSIDEVQEELTRADGSQSSYLFSGRDGFQVDRDASLARVNRGLAAMKALTADNPVQRRRLVELDQLVASRVGIMQESVRELRTQGLDAAATRVASGVGQRASRLISDLTGLMKRDELGLLATRCLDEQERYQGALIALIVAVLIGLIVLGYAGFVVQARARELAERKLTDMAESMPGAVYQCRSDPDDAARPRYEYVSRSVAQLFGFERESLLRDGEPFWARVVDTDRQGLAMALDRASRALEPLRHDFRIAHPSGETKWMRASATVRREPDGTFLWNGYWADITAQKAVERALEETREAAEAANRAKSVFLATMSHEIRTPMNGVLGMLELISLTKLDRPQLTMLDVVRESGTSLLRIIDDILDFSKIEAGKLDVRPEPASVVATVESVRNIFAGIASSKGVLLECKIDPAMSPALLVDPTRLRQILNNLVSNALKFTIKGHIEITAEVIDRSDGLERIRFAVRDTGVGISVENQARLFQPFVQASQGTHTGGTGLGLTISQRLARMMGGAIKMVSELGKGTTMSLDLSLPIADVTQVALARPSVTASWMGTSPKPRRMAPTLAEAEREGTLVLLADDHPTNRSLLGRQLNTLGYAVESASNGVEALAKWKSGRFGIVITDCNMPEMDGYELTRTIRELETSTGRKRVPVVACTANALGGEAEVCLSVGMDDYLAKPIELRDLAGKLDRWLPIAAVAPPLDRAVLAGISGGNVGVDREILADFRRVNDDDALSLTLAVERADLPQVITASHRIKGASRMIGASGLASVCETLETASRANDWTTVQANMGSFHRELARLNTCCEEIQCQSPT